jgi:hypothetical protein
MNRTSKTTSRIRCVLCSLDIPILVKAEQWMITGTFKISVVSRPFLVPIARADITVHIKNSKRSRKNRIFVIASEVKQSKTVRFLRLLRPKGLAMTQKRIIFCVNAYQE